MKVLGHGWEKLLEGYFDHKVTFFQPVKGQDSTGQRTNTFVAVEGLIDVSCAVGDRMLSKVSTDQSSYGMKEPSTVVLISGHHPEIILGWKAIIDGNDNEPYLVESRTPNQSADVSEIPIGRWH